MEQQETQSRGRKRAGIIVAGVAVGALLLSGGTFALWNAAGKFSAASVTNGNLEVAVNGDAMKVVYKSTDMTTSMPVDTAMTMAEFEDFLMVPGDKISMQVPVKLGLEGDNLYAQLSLNTSKLFKVSTGFLDIKAQLYKGDIADPGTIDDANKVGSEIVLDTDGEMTKDFNWFVRSRLAEQVTLPAPNEMTAVPAFTSGKAAVVDPGTGNVTSPAVPASGGLDLVLALEIELPVTTGDVYDMNEASNPDTDPDHPENWTLLERNNSGVKVMTDLSELSLNLLQFRENQLPK